MKTLHKVVIFESERGWGKKIDEVKYFDSSAKAIEFVNDFNSKNTADQVPDWYMYAEYTDTCMAEN